MGRLIFPSTQWAIQNAEFAEKELNAEVEKQFKESGINFEGSLSYHRLSSEICLIGVAIIKKVVDTYRRQSYKGCVKLHLSPNFIVTYVIIARLLGIMIAEFLLNFSMDRN